jgi:hypothetical protein
VQYAHPASLVWCSISAFDVLINRSFREKIAILVSGAI